MEKFQEIEEERKQTKLSFEKLLEDLESERAFNQKIFAEEHVN